MTEAIRKYNNLTQRIITGVLGSAAIITAVCLGPWTYFAVFFFICLLSLLEFYKLAGFDGMIPQKTLGTVCGMCIFIFSFLIEMEILPYKFYFLIYPLVATIFIVKLYKKFERKPFTNIAFTFLGIFYTAVPFALLNIAVFDNEIHHYFLTWGPAVTGNYNYEIILGSLLILWATDTGAYFAGTFFGSRKLFERISPKKTWEGFVGGAVLAMVFAFAFTKYFNSLSDVDWYIISVIIIIGGTFGDLVESLLKRSIEIKDSGTALPGHGGFLDRFDGLLISAPFIVAYLEIF